MMPKKEEQNMDTLVLLRRRNKIPTGGNKETKDGAGSVPPRNPSYIQLQNPDTIVDAHKCWLTEVDIAITWEALLVHDKYRSGCL